MVRYPTYEVFLTAVIALAMTAVLMPVWIRILKAKNIGQIVRIDGPHEHLKKQGVPTMGGLLILAVVSIAYVLMAPRTTYGWVALGTIVACGLVGFFDDYMMVAHSRSLGLRARAKITWQLLTAIVLGLVAVNFVHISTDVVVPLTDRVIPMGAPLFTLNAGGLAVKVPLLYLAFVALVLIATVNSVNLTDGLDGLAAGTITAAMLAYSGIAFRQNRLDLAILCAAVAGACVGFLWYNCHPADIFMGDTGALGLGAALAGLAILTKTEFLLVLIGGIYVLETLSVIGQVLSFRYLGRRILKMAPIHHHFEMLGWSETKVIVRFWIVSGMLSGAGFALYFITAVGRR